MLTNMNVSINFQLLACMTIEHFELINALDRNVSIRLMEEYDSNQDDYAIILVHTVVCILQEWKGV